MSHACIAAKEQVAAASLEVLFVLYTLAPVNGSLVGDVTVLSNCVPFRAPPPCGRDRLNGAPLQHEL